MKKYLFIVLLVGVCFGQDGLFSIFKSKYPKVYCEECDLSLTETINGFICNDGHMRIDKSAFRKDKNGNYVYDADKNNGHTLDTYVDKSDQGFYVNGELRPRWNYTQPKNPFHSGMLSFFMPSGGHIYNEQYSKAMFYMFGVPIIYLVGVKIELDNLDESDEVNIRRGQFIQFVAYMAHLYNVYDAVMSSHSINRKYFKYHLNENKENEERQK